MSKPIVYYDHAIFSAKPDPLGTYVYLWPSSYDNSGASLRPIRTLKIIAWESKTKVFETPTKVYMPISMKVQINELTGALLG
jgi:hypothetical protein